MKRQFATNLAWAAAASWSREVINFCVFLTLARLLGPRTYGIIGMVGVTTAIANGLLFDGLADFIVREKLLAQTHANAVFWIQFAAAGVFSLAMVLPLLYALSSVPAALLQRAMHFHRLTIRSFSAAAGGIDGQWRLERCWPRLLAGRTCWVHH